MLRAYGILSVLMLVGCGSTKSLSYGPDAEAAVQEALDSQDKGESALATGRAVYWVSSKSLRAERERLFKALRETPYPPLEDTEGSTAPYPREIEIVFREDRAVVVWVRSEVFEVACPTGTLRVERTEWPGDPAAFFRLSLLRGMKVLAAGGKRGADIERAWRSLEAAARRQATLSMEGFQSLDRPLASMHDIGVDFRGIYK